MHYFLRTTRCLHAWRSDTVAAINERREARLAAELKARDDEKQAETDGLREALVRESRSKDAEIDRLHKENEYLQKAAAEIDRLHKENEYLRKAEQESGSVHNISNEQLAAQVSLLQELQRRTEADHSRETETHRQQLESYRTENELLRARLREMEPGQQDRSSYIDEMHTKLEQQLKHEVHLMNSSMAALEEKCKSQERELEKLRQYAADAAADGARAGSQLREMKGPLSAQVEELKAVTQMQESLVAELRQVFASSRGCASFHCQHARMCTIKSTFCRPA
jgi:chromosome segregation ATPase